MRPFIPFFNVDDAWLPPRTQVKIKFDLPQTELSRYMIVSDKGGGANNAGSVGPVDIELSQVSTGFRLSNLQNGKGLRGSSASP